MLIYTCMIYENTHMLNGKSCSSDYKNFFRLQDLLPTTRLSSDYKTFLRLQDFPQTTRLSSDYKTLLLWSRASTLLVPRQQAGWPLESTLSGSKTAHCLVPRQHIIWFQESTLSGTKTPKLAFFWGLAHGGHCCVVLWWRF